LLSVRVNSLSPAPCEEGVFYRFAWRCQAVPGSVWRSVLAVAADRPTSSRWLRNRGAHSSESAVIVNRNVFEALPKTPSRTTTSTTFHRLKPCGSPAADAYFTVFPGALQALPVKKFQNGGGKAKLSSQRAPKVSTAPRRPGTVDRSRVAPREAPEEQSLETAAPALKRAQHLSTRAGVGQPMALYLRVTRA